MTEDKEITDKQIKHNFPSVLKQKFKRLAMLTPCMVMTFYVLPQRFETYEDGTHSYLFNFIDLLIVDEAGQVSPEIAAASFALGQKAVVVGDEKQIPPVWGTAPVLDKTLVIEYKACSSTDDFVKLQNNGLNCSESSIMRIASLSCPFTASHLVNYGGHGMFLSEHRRCLDEIISYSNELQYHGELQALRGSANDMKKNPLYELLPPMGYYQVDMEYSKVVGTSRQNEKEADEIAQWVVNNYDNLMLYYQKRNLNVKPQELIGIVTPFKCQAKLIREKLKLKNKKMECKINVGTVHAFQGAEYRVIFFSSTYGNKDGCGFINRNDNLMNVAVSRAKDAFLFFGDIGCLNHDGKSASALLYKKIVDHPVIKELA